MSSITFEVDLSDVEREIQQTVHRFAEEVMRPAGQELDRMAEPADTIAEDSVMWQVMDRYANLGVS